MKFPWVSMTLPPCQHIVNTPATLRPMNAPDPCCDEGSIVEAPEAADFQRPTLSTVDPRGGFTHDPEFVIAGSIDNGNNWNSRSGNHRNQFTC